ncbi:MAG: hypothetical protein NXI30_04530 [bacterium]|nr:hypothetical protein [bacterium]
MTVSVETKRAQSNGDGSTVAFPFGIPVKAETDIAVLKTATATGVETPQVLTTDYTVTLTGSPAGETGGVVNFLSAPASGERVTIYINAPLTQTASLPQSGPFLSEAVESALDRKVTLSKRAVDIAERSPTLYEGDLDGTDGRYDANSNRIVNLATPVETTDAATKGSVDAAIAAALSVGDVTVLTALGIGYTIADYRYQIGDTGSTDVDLETRLGETKSVTDFGATGDGATDDTVAFQAAVDAGGHIFVPPGTYLLDQVEITNEVHIVADPQAILRQRSLTASQDQAILYFSTGSDYSSFEGGQFDGNAAALTGSHTDEEMMAIRVINAPDHITIERTYIHDFLWAAWRFGSGSFSVFRDIHIKDCGKGFVHQQPVAGRVENVTVEGAANNGKAIFQHAVEIRDGDHFKVSNLRVVSFAPDGSGLEPTPNAIAFQRMKNLTAENLVISGFAGTGGNPGIGMDLDSLELSTFAHITIEGGYDRGISCNSLMDCSISDVHIAMEYNAEGSSNHGFQVRTGGLYPPISLGAVSENARANVACRNLRIANVIVTGAADHGFHIQSGDISLSNCMAIGCDLDGFRINESLPSALFVNPPIPATAVVTLEGCVAVNNGQCGVRVTKGQDVSIVGGLFVNNGQDSSAGTNSRCGVVVNDVDRISIIGVDVSDTQSWSTKADNASFEPGATVGDQYEVSLIDPGLVNLGQRILIHDAGGAAVDATAKVVAKYLDDITVEISGGFTFSSSGNLTTLSGTFDTTGAELDGVSGTALDTEIIGRTFVESAGVYRRIIRVDDAANGIIESAFPSDLSGAAIQALRCDVDPIASQQVGVRIESAATEVYLSGVTGGGNVSALYSIADPASIAELDVADAAWVDVASASTIAIPYGRGNVRVTGTTNVNNVTAGFDGQSVRLCFAASLTVADGTGNLRLAGNFSATADDVLELVCDGTNWIEVSRSAN